MNFKELKSDDNKYHVTYAKIGDKPNFIVLDNDKELLYFINENIGKMNLFTINDIIIDINKIKINNKTIF